MKNWKMRVPTVAASALLLVACGKPRPMADDVVSSAPAPDEAPVAASPYSFEGSQSHLNVDQVVKAMDFWLSLTVPSANESEGGPAFTAKGYSVTSMEYEDGLKEFLAGRERLPWLEDVYRHQLLEQFQILRWMEDAGISADPAFRVQARRALRECLINLALEKKSPVPAVTEEAIHEVYTARGDQYRLPAMIEVRIIQVATQEDVAKVLARLDAGESFGSLAGEMSKHESSARKGQIEPFARGSYSKEFEDAAFLLAPGNVTSVTTPAGLFVIQKIANIPAVSIPYDQVKDQIRTELDEKRHRESLEKLMDIMK